MVSISSFASKLIHKPAVVGRYMRIVTGGPANAAVKAAGIAGVGIALYDAHYKAKTDAQAHKTYAQTTLARDSFKRARYMSNGSHFTSIVKDKIAELSLGNKFVGAIGAVAGYVKGFAGNAIDHVVPLALSAGAIFGKGNVGKGSAIGLLAYGVYSAFTGGGRH